MFSLDYILPVAVPCPAALPARSGKTLLDTRRQTRARYFKSERMAFAYLMSRGEGVMRKYYLFTPLVHRRKQQLCTYARSLSVVLLPL